jgi:prepilin-type N-terminal cleavage/methylation domain-containing protein
MKGFSLIEILIVVAIASGIILVVSNLSGNVSVLNTLVSQELQSKSDINQTLQTMTTAIRSAEPSANGAYPINSATTSSFAFYSDIAKTGSAQYVKFFLSSSSIYRGVIAATGTPPSYPTATEVVTDMVDNVIIPSSTSLFSYYNSSYTGTQSAMTSTVDVSPIRLVEISFYSEVQPTQSSLPQYFSTLIDIRNLRSN